LPFIARITPGRPGPEVPGECLGPNRDRPHSD
jgi:hypothetical protein